MDGRCYLRRNKVPTLKQLAEWTDWHLKKYGPNAHCSQPICTEEARKNAIENKPDEKGRRKTRIGLETYSPESYSKWNSILEEVMKRCGFNPILAVDLIYHLLVLEIANGKINGHLHNLGEVVDYEAELREGRRAAMERRKKA